MFRKFIIILTLASALSTAGQLSAFSQTASSARQGSAVTSSAQSSKEPLSALLKEFSPKEGCIEAQYDLSLSASGGATINYPGKLYYQRGLFRVEGNGYTILCDSLHIWTVDTVAKEVVREAALPLDELIPAAGPQNAAEGGLEVQKSADGKKIRSVSLRMKNGTQVSISVPSMKVVSDKPETFFIYDDSAIPSGYVFTALD